MPYANGVRYVIVENPSACWRGEKHPGRCYAGYCRPDNTVHRPQRCESCACLVGMPAEQALAEGKWDGQE